MQLITYKTPREYLDATQAYLEERELDNNLILGLCNGFTDLDKQYLGCHFMNVMEGESIQATSIRTVAKAIVSGTSMNKKHLQPIAEYYHANQPDIVGVWGETFYAEAFQQFFPHQQGHSRTMLVQQLDTLYDVPLSAGELTLATEADLALLTDWNYDFQIETKSFPILSREQAHEMTQRLIGRQILFVWKLDAQAVSIAAIVRKTKNFGLIGFVYTPPALRGRGFGTSIVHQLSQYILNNGLSKCGLFTDQSNPTSNKIYHNIGYRPSTLFSDIEFVLGG